MADQRRDWDKELAKIDRLIEAQVGPPKQPARREAQPAAAPPQGKPSTMRAPDLRRAACVRAFLGEPDLLILERPAVGVHPAIMPALMTAVRAARSRGAAVLWTTDDWEVWNDPGINPTVRCKMAGSQLSVLPGG